VTVELAPDAPYVSGRVTNGRGTAAREAVVLLFADDPGRWTPDSRFIRTARTDREGRFDAGGVPPGRYVAAAIDVLAPGEDMDPAFFHRLRRSGTALRVDLDPGD